MLTLKDTKGHKEKMDTKIKKAIMSYLDLIPFVSESDKKEVLDRLNVDEPSDRFNRFQDKVISRREASLLLNVSTRQVSRLVVSGILRGVGSGSKRCYGVSFNSVQDFISGHSV